MLTLIVKSHFDASHLIPNYPGNCSHLHGHRWNITAKIKIKKLDSLGIGIDFKIIKSILKDNLPDHSHLNIILEKPTAENLSKYLFDKLKKKIPNLISLIVWESPECGVEYK